MLVGQYHLVAFTLNSLGVAARGGVRLVSRRLEGGRILVVGAGTADYGQPDPPVGNGRAIAILAAREGAAVVCADRDEHAAAEQPPSRSGPTAATAEVVVGDVTRRGGVRRRSWRPQARSQGSCCNVGTGRGGGLAGTSADDWDTTFAVNARSHFLLARAALPVLRRRRLDRLHQLAGRAPAG